MNSPSVVQFFVLNSTRIERFVVTNIVFNLERSSMKKKLKIRKPRTRSLFNTGTRPHKSKKDYTRKTKHRESSSEDGD